MKNFNSPKTNLNSVATIDYHPALDVAHLQGMYGQNWTFAEDMFNTFLNEILPSFYKLSDLAEAENWEAYYKIVHRVQPGLQMVGLSSLQQKVRFAETIAKSLPDKEQLLRLTSDFLEDLEKYVVILQKQILVFQQKMTQQ